jgi:hypothetical protein
MRYTVVWGRAAERELARLWTASADRRAVTLAADAIDRLLREDPHRRGESRQDTTRVLLVPPLGVDFEVLAADRMVHVMAVWAYRGRAKN